MDSKETQKGLIRSDILLHNEDYFKYIFKKTEKIVGAVFYTTRSISHDLERDILVKAAEEKALSLMSFLEKTLTAPRAQQIKLLEELRGALVALEGSLMLLSAARIMREDILEVFRHEVVSVQRTLREYTREVGRHPLEVSGEVSSRTQGTRVARASRETAEIGGQVSLTHQQGLVSRRERILEIIRGKGHVTIKDVSQSISDVSEKTIQRELMSLISDGIVLKDGERRWSKYSIR